MRDIIEKQSSNLRKFKTQIRDLKYDLIEAKDRELKWYGKFMNVQRSLAKNGSVLHMSNYKLDGNMDLESSLITIIEANEHLEEESKKILEENKSLKEKWAQSKLELLELQKKYEKNFTLNQSLQKEVDFLRQRFKELHSTFLQRLKDQLSQVRQKGFEDSDLLNPLFSEQEINHEFSMIEQRQKKTDAFIDMQKRSLFKQQLLEIIQKKDRIISRERESELKAEFATFS